MNKPMYLNTKWRHDKGKPVDRPGHKGTVLKKEAGLPKPPVILKNLQIPKEG